MAKAQVEDPVLRRLGYAAQTDLVLHLPLRYEDETRLTPLGQVRPGASVTVQGVIVHTEAQKRPRPQLVVEIEAPPASPSEPSPHPSPHAHRLRFRLLHFRPGQIAHLQPGVWVRLHGEVRSGLFGAEMVHPRYRVVQPDTPLPTTLTPVYPTVAGLSQIGRAHV